MKDIFVLVLIIGLIILGPLLILWALNTLFPLLGIPYTFWTWAAACILAGVFKAEINKS